MGEREEMEKIIDELIDDINTKEIPKIENPDDKESEQIPEELKNQGGI